MTLDGIALDTPERRERGRIVVLPGIEGHSRWNRSIVRGLVDAGADSSLTIHDWTFGRWLSLYTLRASRRHQIQSELIASQLTDYRREHPQAPVWLIGHSGGGAMSVLTLERLAREHAIDGAILLGAALSPRYDLSHALDRTTRGIWNFSSWGDVFFLVAGTLLFGTIDGRHSISAGASGFRSFRQIDATDNRESRVTEVPWTRQMLSCGNLAGHFGYVNRRFVRQWIAPIVLRSSEALDAAN